MLMLGQAFSGMQHIPLVLFSLGLSVLLGCGAILGALLRSRWEAAWIAWACVLFSLCSTLAFLILIGSDLRPLGYAIIASPSILGFVAIALNRRSPSG